MPTLDELISKVTVLARAELQFRASREAELAEQLEAEVTPYTQATDVVIAALAAAGTSVRAIADATGLTRYAVTGRLQRIAAPEILRPAEPVLIEAPAASVQYTITDDETGEDVLEVEAVNWGPRGLTGRTLLWYSEDFVDFGTVQSVYDADHNVIDTIGQAVNDGDEFYLNAVREAVAGP
jgi:hypothetical protein